jgi:hypothetical protein
MKRENENPIITKRYKIPQDLAMDIFRLVISNQVKYSIAGVMEKKNVLIMELSFVKGTYKSAQAKENIETMLKEYKDYLNDTTGDSLIDSEEENEF